MTIKLDNWQRIESVVKLSGLSINAFARYLGLPRGENLYQIKKGNNGISRDLAQRIIHKFPQISFSWLMTGRGTMLADDNGNSGIPLYRCSDRADVERLYMLEPDDFVMLPGYEDCNIAIERNWDPIPGAAARGPILLLRRLTGRNIRENKYLVVTEGLVDVCTVKRMARTGKLRLSGTTVPNGAMVIESAERFGLSQLHQLRGRVGRGADQSYCILMSGDKLSSESRKRLGAMVSTNDGFELAEMDLQLRGPGDLSGTLQSGLAFDLKIADLGKDGQVLTLARNEAERVLQGDPMLAKPENRMLRELAAKYVSKKEIDFSMIS